MYGVWSTYLSQLSYVKTPQLRFENIGERIGKKVMCRFPISLTVTLYVHVHSVVHTFVPFCAVSWYLPLPLPPLCVAPSPLAGLKPWDTLKTLYVRTHYHVEVLKQYIMSSIISSPIMDKMKFLSRRMIELYRTSHYSYVWSHNLSSLIPDPWCVPECR